MQGQSLQPVQSKRRTEHVHYYGLTKEHIPPYARAKRAVRAVHTHLQRGKCAWQYCFGNLASARATVTRYIEHYNTQLTHSALKYNTPRQTYLTLCNPPHQRAV